MYRYQFRRESKYLEFGVVTASSEEEAIEMIENGDYDDIIDNSFVETIPETIEIESTEELDEDELEEYEEYEDSEEEEDYVD